jgi:hypothetical protein
MLRSKKIMKIFYIITNKTAWIRLVSSIDVLIKIEDQNYFERISQVINIYASNMSLARKFCFIWGNFCLYSINNSYQLRSGLSNSNKTMGALMEC